MGAKLKRLENIAKAEPSADRGTPSVSRSALSLVRILSLQNLLLVTLAGLSLYICFWNLDEPSIHHGDERIHVMATQSMWFSGRWWLPTVGGVPYFNKPPLKMWLTFIPLHFLGFSNFSFRLIDALAGLVTIFSVYFLGRKFFRSEWAGFFSSIALLGSWQYIFPHGVREAVQDSMLLLIVTWATYAGYRSLSLMDQGRESREVRRISLRLALCCGILVGLGAMVKSVAAILVFIVLGVFHLATRLPRTWFAIDWGVAFRMLLPAFGIPALWFVPHLLFSPTAAEVMFGQEVERRIQVGYHNPARVTYYLEQLLYQNGAIPPLLLVAGIVLGFVGWIRGRVSPPVLAATGLILAAVGCYSRLLSGKELVRFVSIFVRLMVNPWMLGAAAVAVLLIFARGKLAPRTEEERTFAFLVCWALVPLIFYTCIPSRLFWYIFPSLPPMAILAGWVVRELFAQSANLVAAPVRLVKTSGVLAGVIGVFAVGLLSSNVVRVTEEIAHVKVRRRYSERDLFDRVTRSLLELQQEAPGVAVINYRVSNWSKRDMPYRDSMTPFLRQTSSPEELSEWVKSTENPTVITESQNVAEVLSAGRPVAAYQLIPPNLLRTRWLWILSFGTKVPRADFTPAVQTISLGAKAHDATAYGFVSAESLKQRQVRFVKAGRAGVLVNGDRVTETLGARLAFAGGRLRKSRAVKVEVFVNDLLIGTISDLPAAFEKFEFVVPPGILADGTGMVSFVATRLDGGVLTGADRSMFVESVTFGPRFNADRVGGGVTASGADEQGEDAAAAAEEDSQQVDE